jgi:hypothetical protein
MKLERSENEQEKYTYKKRARKKKDIGKPISN